MGDVHSIHQRSRKSLQKYKIVLESYRNWQAAQVPSCLRHIGLVTVTVRLSIEDVQTSHQPATSQVVWTRQDKLQGGHNEWLERHF